MRKNQEESELLSLKNVGKATYEDLRLLGITRIEELKSKIVHHCFCKLVA